MEEESLKTGENDEVIAQEVEQFNADLRPSQLRELFNFMSDVYFVVKNRAGAVMMANSVAVRLCGFDDESQMIGKTDLDIFSAERAEVYIRDDLVVFETGKSVIEHVELAPNPNNAINWFVTTKIPLYSHDDQIIGLACVARDMTGAHEKLRPYMELNEALGYVRENYSRPIKIEDLAELVHLSRSQFERRFRKTFHITPTMHIMNVRVRAACSLLMSTYDTIASIAIECGFYDHSHFIRNFRKVMGMTPRHYRETKRSI